MKQRTLSTNISVSDRAQRLIEEFDQQDFYKDMMDGLMVTNIWVLDNDDLPDSWSVGLIYGPSGSGKSTQIAELGLKEPRRSKKPQPLCDLVPNDDILFASGLNNILVNLRPYFALSNGQKHRADIALALQQALTSNKTVVVDEFTSVLDRHAAYAVCAGINSLRRRYGDDNFQLPGQVVFATPHNDIAEWLHTDWEYDMWTGEYRASGSTGTRRDTELSLFDAPDAASSDQ